MGGDQGGIQGMAVKGIVHLNFEISPIYCSPRFVIHITVPEFNTGKEFRPTEACCGQAFKLKAQHVPILLAWRPWTVEPVAPLLLSIKHVSYCK